MATTPATQLPATSPAEDIEQRYRRLHAQWSAETMYLSDPGKIMAHPAMRAIVALGEQVVPMILRGLQTEASLVVWALPEITGENPAPPTVHGGFAKCDVAAQIDAWLRWGRARGLV